MNIPGQNRNRAECTTYGMRRLGLERRGEVLSLVKDFAVAELHNNGSVEPLAITRIRSHPMSPKRWGSFVCSLDHLGEAMVRYGGRNNRTKNPPLAAGSLASGLQG